MVHLLTRREYSAVVVAIHFDCFPLLVVLLFFSGNDRWSVEGEKIRGGTLRSTKLSCPTTLRRRGWRRRWCWCWLQQWWWWRRTDGLSAPQCLRVAVESLCCSCHLHSSCYGHGFVNLFLYLWLMIVLLVHHVSEVCLSWEVCLLVTVVCNDKSPSTSSVRFKNSGSCCELSWRLALIAAVSNNE